MPSILIIDNEFPIRKNIYNYFENDGYIIQTTKSGSEGIQLAFSNDFNFILIEQDLTDHDGLRVLQAIKKMKPETVCFIIAKNPSYESAVKAANLGACSYIPKPLSYEGLIFHLRKGEKHRQLYIEALNLRKERHENLLELSREKSAFKTVLNSINGGVLVINKKGELVYYNNASLVYLNVDDLEVGEYIIDRLPNKIIQQVSDYLFAKSYIEKVREIEVEMIPNNKLHIQAVCSHIPKNSNDYSGVILVTRDITNKKKIEQIKSQFVSMVAHELKTPLVAVQGFLQILNNPEIQITDEKRDDFLSRSSDRLGGLFQLVNDLLDISRMEVEEKKRDLENIDFENVVKSVTEFLELDYKKKNITLNLNIKDNLPKIKAEKEDINRLVTNLVSNAIKYNNENGTISLTASSEDNYLMFEIEDTGIGIKEEDKPKVFQEFFRAMNKETRSVSGTGLGLAIVKGIVKSYHGKIYFDSTYRKGTKFTVKLPISKTIYKIKPNYALENS
ncbi:MAG: ATP-binding protein [Bacteroidota bacterium]